MDNSVKQTEAMQRLAALFDDGVFTEIDAFAKNSEGDVEVVAAYGSISGVTAYAFSQDVSTNDGAIGVAQCAKILKVYKLAEKTGCPVVGIYDSNGVKLSEGFEALSAYGELVKASTSLSGVVPQISVVAGACLGTSALIAEMADVVVGVKSADMYVTAPADITMADNGKCGAVDVIVDTFDEAVCQVKKILALMPSNNISPLPLFDFAEPTAVSAEGMSASELVASLADLNSVVEIKAEYGKKIYTALATVAGSPVGFVAFDDNDICQSCAYKAEGIIKLCDAYNIPLVTVANATGLKKDGSEKLLISLAKLTSAYATATCPKISLVTNKAIGCAYIILAGKGANSDLTFAWDNAVVSPLDVSASVAFLYNDRLANGENRQALEDEYSQTIGSAFTAAACGAVDDVFAPENTRAKLITAIDMLSSKRETTIARKHSVK